VVQAQLLDQPVDLSGRHAVHVGLLDDRDQGLLSSPAGLEEAGEVGALAQLGDGQLDLTDPGVPSPRAIPIAMRGPLRAALAEFSADLATELGLHELGGHPGHALAQHVGVLVLEELVGELGSGHPVAFGHRGVSFVDPWTDRRS